LIENLAAEEKRVHLSDQIKALFLGESQLETVVVILEDLHWIDRVSEELLTHLINSIPRAPILLICTYRPDYVHRWSYRTYTSQIVLNQFSEVESLVLMHELLGTPQLPEDIWRLVLEKAGGNPFYIEEVTRSLVEDRIINKLGQEYVLGRHISEINVPTSIQDIAMARIDRLDEPLKTTLQIASVIGKSFPLKILERVSDAGGEVRHHLRRFLELEMIYEKDIFEKQEYLFKDNIIQSVAYDSLLIRRRQVYHQSIGQAMEEIYANRLEDHYELLAYHYRAGGDVEKALQYMVLAGEKAVELFAYEDAKTYYEESVEMADKIPDEQARKRYLHQIQGRLNDISSMSASAVETLSTVESTEERIEIEEVPTEVEIDEAEVDVLDTSGESCPIPEILLKKKLMAWQSGQTLRFITDDPVAVEFIPKACEKKGYGCRIESQEGDRCTFLIYEIEG
jgi:predicted ATPase